MTELILGPPGTGKTSTLINIVDDEIGRGTPPNQIGYVSFTKRASHESVERSCKKFNLVPNDLPYFRTLHSLCFRALGIRQADVFEGEKVQEWAKYAKVKVTGHWSEDGTLSGYENGDRVLFIENMSRIRGITLRDQYLEDPEPTLSWRQLETAALSLEKFKKEYGLLDYTDMIQMFVDSNICVPLAVLLVDEAQDLSALQWRMVNKLSLGVRRVVVAGDDDQAIYAWAGADVNHLINLQGRVRVLNQSWRVPKNVQEIANSIITKVKVRRPKSWRPRLGVEGIVDRVFNFESVNLDGDDIMVLARNAFVLKNIEAFLRSQAIIYEKRGHPSIKSKYLQAMLIWERLRKGEFASVADIRRVYEYMSTGIGVKRGFKKMTGFGDDMEMNLSGLKVHGGLLTDAIWHEALDRIPLQDREYMLAARQRGEKFSTKPRIRISTIHTAKGAEARHVILMLEVARRTDREAELNPDDELRVWYVAVTRAKERLTLVEPQSTQSLRCKWL